MEKLENNWFYRLVKVARHIAYVFVLLMVIFAFKSDSFHTYKTVSTAPTTYYELGKEIKKHYAPDYDDMTDYEVSASAIRIHPELKQYLNGDIEIAPAPFWFLPPQQKPVKELDWSAIGAVIGFVLIIEIVYRLIVYVVFGKVNE